MNDNRQAIRSFAFLLILGAWLPFVISSKGATLVTAAVLNPTDDANVRSGFSNQKKNFGAEPVLELEGGRNEAEAYFKFSLADVEGAMKQATFRFYAGTESASVVTLAIKSVGSKDWAENTITWKEKPEQVATVGQVQLVGKSPTWYEVDLTSVMKAALEAGNTSLSVAMVSLDGGGNKVSIHSRESTENKPELVLARSLVKVRIVFRPTEVGAPPGYFVDSGSTYSPHTNGYTYGWNQDVSKYVADRNSPTQAAPKQARSPDLRYAGVACMDNPDFPKPAFWGISLPNATYSVHVVAGDPGFYDSVYAINLNDTLILEGIPDQGKRWVESTKTVAVANQKLILTNNPKGINNKLCFIEIQEVRESAK
jgi:hypothetical protein